MAVTPSPRLTSTNGADRNNEPGAEANPAQGTHFCLACKETG